MTNGLLLSRQSDEFWKVVDRVEVSLYPNIKLKLDLCYEKARTYKVDLNVYRRETFQETILDSPIEDDHLRRKIFAACIWARTCITMRDGYLHRCPVSPFIDKYLAKLGYDTDFAHNDGLVIADTTAMPEKIRSFLRGTEPLGACRFCLGSVGKKFPHRFMSSDETKTVRKLMKYQDALDRDLLSRGLKIAWWEGLFTRFPDSVRYHVRSVLLKLYR